MLAKPKIGLLSAGRRVSKNAQRHADQHGDAGGNNDEKEVLQDQFTELAAILGEEFK